MRILVCFLIILHITGGRKYAAYDAKNCGKSQISTAQSSVRVRARRSSIADAPSNDTSIGDDSASQESNDNAPDDEEEDDFMQQKIMGGRRAERGELPWAVFIQIWMYGYGTGTPGYCGGTLISRRHVLTAAHCFQVPTTEGQCSTSDMYSPDLAKVNTEVFIGGTCISAGNFGCTRSDIGKVYKVARVFYKDYFKFGCRVTHDIAILELSKDVPKTINHVCLPFMHKLEEIEDPYLKLRAFGWGKDRISPYLQVTDLGAKLPEAMCNGLNTFKTEDTFCLKSGIKDLCIGDSGGGVTATIRGRTYLMGIAVMAPDCDLIVANAGVRFDPQTCTDIMYYKNIIKKWIRAKRTSKPEAAKPLNRKLHSLLDPNWNPFSSILKLPTFHHFPMLMF